MSQYYEVELTVNVLVTVKAKNAEAASEQAEEIVCTLNRLPEVDQVDVQGIDSVEMVGDA